MESTKAQETNVSVLENGSQDPRSRSDGNLFWPGILLIGTFHLMSIGAAYYYSWSAVIGLVLMHQFFFIIGSSIGYHRLVAHKSYIAHPILYKSLMVLGALNGLGGPLWFSSVHRRHHFYSKRIGDAHYAERGFWWSHLGWLLYDKPNGYNFKRAQTLVKDLRTDPFAVFVEKHHLKLIYGFTLIGFLACFAFNRLDLFFWCFPLRMVAVWHTSWLGNSFLHNAWNKQECDYEGFTDLRNSHLFNMIGGGEGFHRTHHCNPWSPRVGFRWYEPDLSWLIIKGFIALGWARIPKSTYQAMAKIQHSPTTPLQAQRRFKDSEVAQDKSA